MTELLAVCPADLSAVQVIGFLGLAALAGGITTDLLFGRHERTRRRAAEVDAARLRRHVMHLEGRTGVRRRRPRHTSERSA